MMDDKRRSEATRTGPPVQQYQSGRPANVRNWPWLNGEHDAAGQ
jgi:hypothetical protein